MKIKNFFLFLMAAAVFACNTEETVQFQEETNNFTVEVGSQGTESNGPGRSSGCLSIGTWVPPTVPNNTSGTIMQITYSDDPNDYPSGVVDIDCTRYEYFNNYCLLRMTQIQNSDPYKDTWIKLQNPPLGCFPRPKDDVEVSTTSDPRVCVGTACDD